MVHRRSTQGFTLVEILIVVVILGILAAIVIPQFTQASESARASNLKSQLQTLRSQIELYQVQHNGDYPDLNTDWTPMTETSDASGNTDADGPYGPYLQQPLSNPFFDGDAATAVDENMDSASDVAGWSYNSDNGNVKANIPDDVNAEELGLDNDEDFSTGDNDSDP